MSSDSEDDCYGNVAQRLQKMKNKYEDDKIECTNLLNDSTDSTNELDIILNKANVPAKSEKKNATDIVLDVPAINESDSSEIFIDNLLAASSQRVTRSGAKKRGLSDSFLEGVSAKSSRKSQKEPIRNESDSSNAQTNRGRGRGRNNSRQIRPRGRRGRGRGRQSQPIISNTYPTYSIGNTDEYPDQSDNQLLFSKPNTDISLIEEDDPLDDNEELSVKVYWQSSELFKFPIRKYQKLMLIFNYFSKKGNVSQDKLLLTYKDKILKPDDTPDSINYSIAKFIEGGIVNQSISKLVMKDTPKPVGGIIIKFQCQNIKKPYETTVRLEDKLSLAMIKCAEHFEISINKLRFEFDGDSISEFVKKNIEKLLKTINYNQTEALGKNTPKDLELEGGECIDVKIVS